ncbi:hypothetical protein PFISCL1PPCAC_14795, partial [Pristionchus fissidentatus]
RRSDDFLHSFDRKKCEAFECSQTSRQYIQAFRVYSNLHDHTKYDIRFVRNYNTERRSCYRNISVINSR